ncbi:MAG: UDP-2,3-diacylglucosamine diphosphatase LpxI [Pseudomonadota bacterium]
MSCVGIIAGAGVLPLFVAHEALKRGFRVVVIAFSGFTDPAMEEVIRETFWLKLGQLERAISVLKSHGIDRVVMVGKIEKINLLRLWNLRPDFRALRVIRSMEDWRDDTVLAAIAAELSREGIVVDEITQWAESLMAPCGVLTKRSPDEKQWRDIEFGRGMAQGIGALDIGQTVVVKNAAVLVAEAIEGTDKAIRRAADLDVPGGVVVKMAKPGQDMRFDVPGVGTSTIDSMIVAKAGALAVEAGKTLIADFSDMIQKADDAGIAIVGIPAEGPVR